MSEREKLPFEKAEYNIRKFVESVDMLQTLLQLFPVLESAEGLPKEEKEIIHEVIDKSLIMLSKSIARKGQKWN